MRFFLFNDELSQAEAINLLQQIVDPSIPKASKEKAMKRFDKTYRPKIQKWALQFGMPQLEAEELFNEIYLKLPKIIANLIKKQILQLDLYLKGVVKIKVCNYFNALKKQPPFELTDDDFATRADMNDSALHHLCKVEQTLRFKAALESPELSDQCRQLIADYYASSKLTMIQIAEQNEEMAGAVRQCKRRCLLKLKAILLKMGFKEAHLLEESFYQFLQ